MIANNMTFGNHTHSHPWLNALSLSKQEMEITKSLNFPNSIGIKTKKWMMCSHMEPIIMIH